MNEYTFYPQAIPGRMFPVQTVRADHDVAALQEALRRLKAHPECPQIYIAEEDRGRIFRVDRKGTVRPWRDGEKAVETDL